MHKFGKFSVDCSNLVNSRNCRFRTLIFSAISIAAGCRHRRFSFAVRFFRTERSAREETRGKFARFLIYPPTCMDFPELIRKKRDGRSLSREEIFEFIERYTRGEIPDYQCSALL